MSSDWKLQTDGIMDAVNGVIEKAKALQVLVVGLEEKRTFGNTVHQLDAIYGEAFNEVSRYVFGYLVAEESQVREVANEAKDLFDSFVLESRMDEGIYGALCEYRDGYFGEEKSVLSDEDVRLLDKMLLDFERNGLSLSNEDRTNVKSLKTKIASLSSECNKNISNVDVQFEFTKDELVGMPDSFFGQLKKNEDKYVVGLQYPQLFPVLRCCQNPEVRKTMLTAHLQKCKDENITLQLEVFKLRHQAAELLGYDSDASYVLSDKMAGNLETALQFLKDLREKFEPQLLTYYEELLQIKSDNCLELGIENDGVLNEWDLSYLLDNLKNKKYSVNNEEIRQYFPMQKVTKGTMEAYEMILGLRYEKDEEAEVWHPSVEKYKVFDSESDEFFGYFFLDLFPRKGKYSHAACFPIEVAYTDTENRKHFTSSCMVSNFSPPTEDSGSLFLFSEVHTFFHEFGHVMHSLLSRSKYSRLNWRWDAVEQDFLEVPSMMFENFVLDPEVLALISGHHETGEPLPEFYVKKLRDVDEVGYAYRTSRLIFMSLCDLAFHSTHANANLEEIMDMWDSNQEFCVKFKSIPGTTPFSGWNHMTAGYNAGYYGYLWAEVFASDLFSIFKEKGVLDQQTGMSLRQNILSPCTILPANEMFQNFLSRKPNNSAYLKEHNI